MHHPADPDGDALLPTFTEVYAPSQNLSLDETLVKFKG